MKYNFDYLIVGAGLMGSTFAYLAKEKGKRCLVIDRRPQVGGNLYCQKVEGINVHFYGAHIFHTTNKSVWDFVNSFVSFNRFTNAPLAMYKGHLYNLPFNMNTFYQMWGVWTPEEAQRIIDEQRQKAIEAMHATNDHKPRNLEEQALVLVGRDIYEKLIKGYTEKQWGRCPRELPAFIIKRLPIKFSYDNNYFNDTYQGCPVGGYNLLIDGLLKGTQVILDTDYFQARSYWNSMAPKIVFTGCVDQFFDYELGHLSYRSLLFEHTVYDKPNYQGNAVINYTDTSVPFTRSIEHKHFEMMGDEVYSCPYTVVSREYPQEWQDGLEPYYPVNDERNTILINRYRERCRQEKHVIFAGRLAEYKYYDMAPVIERAFALV